MNKTVDQACKEIVDLMTEINKQPDFHSLMLSKEDEFSIPTVIYVHDRPEGVSDVTWNLYETLKTALDSNLIDNDGQCSDAFYKMKDHGFLTRVVDRDSFGPLACSVSYPNSEWRICYG